MYANVRRKTADWDHTSPVSHCCSVSALQRPVWLGWGCEDPWEPLAAGRDLGKIPTVERFVELPGVGHCPQDEAPDVVNSLAVEMIQKYKDA